MQSVSLSPACRPERDNTPAQLKGKFLCIAEFSTLNKPDQTYANIQQILVNALVDYDTNVIPASVLPFSPIAQLTKCP